MRETWLRSNTRALAFSMALPAIVFVIGVLLAAGIADAALAARVVGSVLAVLAASILVVLLLQFRQPRLAYEPDELLVFLRAGGPVRVPIEYVEGFLLGQGESMIPARQLAHRETRNLVVRLAERAEQWQRVDVKHALGYWCGGYITIRGAWCEPLSVPLVNRLNARLAEVHAQQKQKQAVA